MWEARFPSGKVLFLSEILSTLTIMLYLLPDFCICECRYIAVVRVTVTVTVTVTVMLAYSQSLNA